MDHQEAERRICLICGRAGEAVALNNLSHFDQDQFLETQHVMLDDFGVSGYYDDTAVFHLLNYISSVSGTLLIISPYPVAQYKTFYLI